ncbi:unannotated protein [freshwater metagenome]|uniref:Unannotated protein n=1 Tax=freshwater metagenome TaxID=449393 RepID=A0A6J6JXG5_9ZZZZ
MKKTGCNGRVGKSIDKDETAHVTVLAIGIERNCAIEIDIADADFVQLKRASSNMFKRIDVHLVLRLRQGRAHCSSTDLEQIWSARKHLVVVHPDDVCLKLISNGRGRKRCCNDVTTTDVDFISKGDRDGLAGNGFI